MDCLSESWMAIVDFDKVRVIWVALADLTCSCKTFINIGSLEIHSMDMTLWGELWITNDHNSDITEPNQWPSGSRQQEKTQMSQLGGDLCN